MAPIRAWMECRRCVMIGNGQLGSRTAIVDLASSAWASRGSLLAQARSAADCPGHPDAIGTSRTLVVDPREHPRIGTMQYPETLPLRDHEVVLTFDDGPLPRNSNQVLQILADNCVKATFFIIGQQARANPEGVRKLAAAGHTIGTHSQNHPLTFDQMPVEKARQQIDDGIASVSAALSDPPCACAVLPDSGPAARRWRRRISGVARHPGLERGFSCRRLAPHLVGARLLISRSSGWRPRARASCCCTTSRRARWRRCRRSCTR